MRQIVFLFILAAAAGCTPGQPDKTLSEYGAEVAAQKAPAAEQTRRAEYVPVSHKWKERDLDVFIGPKRTDADIFAHNFEQLLEAEYRDRIGQ